MYNGNNQNNWSKPRNDQKNSYSQEKETPAIKHEVLTKDNYSDLAEQRILAIKKRVEESNQKNAGSISTAKLRDILSMALEVYYALPKKNVGEKVELDAILDRINYFKIRCYYEASREQKVKGFIEDTDIFWYLEEFGKLASGEKDEAKDILEQQFILFVRYMEALVAFRAYHMKG